MNDAAVQQGRAPAAVKPAAAIQGRRRRLAVGDENDLAIGAAIGSEQLAGITERLFDIGAVLHEIGERNDRRQILRMNQLGVGTKRHEVERVLRILGLNQAV